MKEQREAISSFRKNALEDTQDDLLAYTPGVAQPCLEIQKDINKSYKFTRRHNLCAVVTDGTAALRSSAS